MNKLLSGESLKKTMDKSCRICGLFQKEGWTVENRADGPVMEKFPEEFHSLLTYEVKNEGTHEGYYRESTLQCPRCGRIYNYECRLPGGSYDAMVTWVVERLTPVMKKGKHMQKNIPPKPEKVESVPEFVCPACGSEKIECVNAGNIGGEVFIELKCLQCGNDGLLDEYQLMNWRPGGNREK